MLPDFEFCFEYENKNERATDPTMVPTTVTVNAGEKDCNRP